MENTNSSFSWSLFNKAPIVGIIRGQSKEVSFAIAKTSLEAELYTLEITMNTNEATTIIAHLRKNFPKLNIGAGTVCSLKECKEAIEAGAQFIVTPILNEEVIKYCVSKAIPIFPGAYSPTEIYKAWSLGASAVKIFPATQLGPKYIKDILGPLNTIELLPTGGVTKNTIKSFFEAGVKGVGMGSSLYDKNYIANNDFISLKEHFKEVKKEIHEFCEN